LWKWIQSDVVLFGFLGLFLFFIAALALQKFRRLESVKNVKNVIFYLLERSIMRFITVINALPDVHFRWI